MCGLTAPDRFRAAYGALAPALRVPPVAIAVSGGSDSLALLLLAAECAGPDTAGLIALSVDHGLRPEAAEEAARVGEVCAARGIAHRTLRLEAPAPRQTALRRARHVALAGAARQAGARLLLTGHTADDQAETFLMRARQGSGWYGLAGIRPLSLSPVWPEGEGVWIGRPLLELRRQTLRDWLSGQGIGWAEDPSNLNPAYERVRMRRLLAAQPGLYARILACRETLQMLRSLEDRALARWMARQVRATAEGLHIDGFADLPADRAARGLGLAIQIAAGRDVPARADAVTRLAGRLRAGSAFRGATLGGARLMPRQGGIRLVSEGGGGSSAGAGARARRLAAMRAILSGTVSEIDAVAGKESFLGDLMPIF